MALKLLVLSALLATQAPAHAAQDAPETAAEAAGRAYWTWLTSQLAASASPRERAFAARGSVVDGRAGGDAALRAAAQAAPGDVLVQMLWSTIGKGAGDRVRAWERVEPRNGFARMTSFQETQESGDDRAIDAEIARIAAAERYDDHFVEFWRGYRKAIAARPMPVVVAESFQPGSAKASGAAAARDQASAVMAMGSAVALPLPMAALSRACRRADHPQLDPKRFEDCARIGRGIMASDSSVISKMMGSALVRMSGLEDDADRQARRALDWRQAVAAKAVDDRRPGSLAAYFADLDATGSETRAQELAMSRDGFALDPPADWKP